MCIDQLGDDVISPEHAHVLDEACVVDVPDIERLEVRINDGGGGDDKCSQHVKNSKRRQTACPLGEVVEVRRVDHFEIDGVLHGRLDKNLKEDPAKLEAVGAGQRFLPEDDVKDILEGK